MYRAIKDRIIIKLDILEEKGNLILEPYKFRNIGTVIGVGEDVKDVRVGEKIIFWPFHEIELPEADLAIIREKSVLGILRN
ncbi:MAG: hypothetical protein J6039_02985 [Alphaproteobacteria bacterium]|nr:hypothetical protein [Alphaproteobacteria bacterium]